MRKQQIFISLVILLGGAFLGCRSNKFGASPEVGKVGTSSGTMMAPGFASDPEYQKLLKEVASGSHKNSKLEQATAPIGSVGGKLKRMASSVAHKMQPKPKVTPADDPVSLSSKPVSIGVGVYYAAGRLADHNGNAEEAIKQYARALDEDPKHLPSLVNLARVYDRQGQSDQAVSYYRRALKVDAKSPTVHNDLGLCLSRRGELDQAEAELRRAVQLVPDRKLYRNNLATVLVEMGKNNDAWQQLQRVHGAAIAHYNMGYLLNRANKKVDAQREFQLAVQADASLSIAQTMLDRVTAELGHAAPAVTATEVAALPAAAHRVAAAPVSSNRVAAARSQPHRSVALSGAQQLRRIPSPDPKTPVAPRRHDAEPTPPPAYVPAPVSRPPAAQQPRSPAAPVSTPQSMRYPVRPTAGYVSDDPDQQADLPTPNLLDTPELLPAEPNLLPTPGDESAK